MQNKLKTMRTKNPKEFWKILNKSKRKEQPDIPVDTFFEFYKELNQKPNQKDTPNLPEPEVQETNQINEEINKYIDKNEILNCIKKLKCNKASGEDYITNEYIKATATQFINIYEKLFNVIFDTGIIPDIWLIGSIKPIFKNKGNKYDPNNFRPITILSCLGKLFTSILNDRLNTFSEEFKVLNESQCNNTPLLIVYLSFIPSSNVSKVKIKNYFVLSWTLKKRSTKSGVKHYGTNFY